jgi:5-methylcytosine-specific restriction endonuclease McrA
LKAGRHGVFSTAPALTNQMRRGIIVATEESTKMCGRCNQSFPLHHFSKASKASKAKDGLCAWCKPCHLDFGKQWRLANRDKHLASSRKGYQRHRETRVAKGREYRASIEGGWRAYQAQWRERNPGRATATFKRYAEKHPDRIAATQQKYQRANPEKFCAKSALRRARKQSAPTGDKAQLAAFWKWSKSAPRISCHWCGKTTTPKNRNVDHVIPLSKGGADAVGNLCISCPSCNFSKCAKMPEDFTGQSELRLV